MCFQRMFLVTAMSGYIQMQLRQRVCARAGAINRVNKYLLACLRYSDNHVFILCDSEI